jgi:hypothetical protein
VEHGAVADVAVLLDHCVLVREAVDRAVVLHVGAALEHDAAEVAAQARAGPDIAAGADDHVADQHGRGMDVGGGIDHRHDAFECIAGHAMAPARLEKRRARASLEG